MSESESVEITGHLMDQGILSRVLDDIREYGGDYTIDRFDVGRETDDTSHAVITVTTEDEEGLQRLLMRLQTRGVNMVDPGEAEVAAATMDGVFPDGFYSSTNLDTRVRIDGRWLNVGNPEMDCGLILERNEHGAPHRVYTLPMSDVRAGMQVVCGAAGVQVSIPRPEKVAGSFGFMESEVSSEKPQAVLVRQVAEGMREAKAAGKKVLWVGGPGRRAHRRGAGDGGDGQRGVRRRAVRRQRPGHPRHRGGPLRHQPGHRPGDGQRRGARPRAPHPGAQHDPQGGLDREGGRDRAC